MWQGISVNKTKINIMIKYCLKQIKRKTTKNKQNITYIFTVPLVQVLVHTTKSLYGSTIKDDTSLADTNLNL
jgi:hypothetical protein